MFKIYKKNVFSPHFQNTLYSGIFLLFAPALTNIYYIFRPNSGLANILPFAMPIMALAQYINIFTNDMKKYCFVED